ncbi:MAG TPA: ABC transporter substrate-binding protein [Methylomirabilota bacterium]|nr:ABC transporter substrate-binding protein [Methylomirabilota bacterium]
MLGIALALQTTLTIGVAGPVSAPEYLPVRVAEAAGYFAEERLAVTIRSFRSGADAAEALGAGRVDLAAAPLDASLRLGHARGAPPRLVFGLTAAPPVALVVPVARQSEVRQPADLEGKTVGITAPGTPEAEALSALLARVDVRPERVTTASYGERRLAAALAAGEVPAAVIGDPWLTRLARDGQVVALADLRKAAEAGRWLGGESVHAAVFLAPGSPLGVAELQPLARALLRGLRRVQTAPAGELAALLGRGAEGEAEEFALRLEGAREAFLAGGLVTESALEGGLEIVQGRARLPAVLKLKPLEQLLFLEPLRRAQGSLGR